MCDDDEAGVPDEVPRLEDQLSEFEKFAAKMEALGKS
jgi:hypothetical protein